MAPRLPAAATMALIPFLLLLVATLLPTPCFSDDAYIRDVCRVSLHPDFCVTFLIDDSSTLNCSDVSCLVPLALNSFLTDTDYCVSYMESYLDGPGQRRRRPSAEEDLTLPLQECISLFSKASLKTTEMMGEVHDKDYLAAYVSIGEMGGYGDDCEGFFPTQPSMVKNLNVQFAKGTDIVSELLLRLMN